MAGQQGQDAAMLSSAFVSSSLEKFTVSLGGVVPSFGAAAGQGNYKGEACRIGARSKTGRHCKTSAVEMAPRPDNETHKLVKSDLHATKCSQRTYTSQP
eukprot:3944812-Amphidinium_carterae.1